MRVSLCIISVALTIGSNAKWVAEQRGTSLQMIQSHYARYTRQDGDALLRDYAAAKPSVTGTVTQAA
jgi:hypothetical protein